ncbi:ribokinase-like [Acanthaster planci]|uniref:Ribokinase n=1 Tax=Acanthaster planci TaxID=133434 RepID=A0A8B7Y5V8_ACAPL|nr:ribokinase-like [Acanthaster planci]
MAALEEEETALDVVVVGSCNTDLISYVCRLPKPGETIHGSKFTIGFGGKGANQCVMAAKMGAKTAMVAKVGDDTFGHETIKNFRNCSVLTDFIAITQEAATGAAPIAVDDEGQNSIIIVSGANLLLTPYDAEKALSAIKATKVLLCQLEVNPETTLAAMKVAQEKGITTVLNPAPAIADLHPDFYKFCDIICPNETEAELLTGLQVTSVEEAKDAAKILLERGCKKVIITLGGQGSLLALPDSEPAHVPARAVKAVDTTGAGDCYVGALAYYLAVKPHLSLEEMSQKASYVASISVQSPGTQTSYPTRKDLPTDLF